MNTHTQNQEQIASDLIDQLSSVAYAEAYETIGWEKMKEKIQNEIILDNRDIVLLMIDKLKKSEQPVSGIEILKFCSNNLKTDNEIIFNALDQNGWNFAFLNNKQKNNKDLVLIATKYNGNTIRFASKRLKNDRDFCIIIAKQSGYMLNHVNKKLQDDKELVLIIINHYGMLLEYASDRLKNDKEVALVAVTKTANAINIISKQLREEIGSNEPVMYLKSAILCEKLYNKIPTKNDKIQLKRKI